MSLTLTRYTCMSVRMALCLYVSKSIMYSINQPSALTASLLGNEWIQNTTDRTHMHSTRLLNELETSVVNNLPLWCLQHGRRPLLDLRLSWLQRRGLFHGNKDRNRAILHIPNVNYDDKRPRDFSEASPGRGNIVGNSCNRNGSNATAACILLCGYETLRVLSAVYVHSHLP